MRTSCPFPTALHRYTPADWNAATADIQCSSNDAASCAAGDQPLTQDVVANVQAVFAIMDTAAQVMAQAGNLWDCEQSSTTVQALQQEVCDNPNMMRTLLVVWIALTVFGALSAFLFTALLLLRRAMLLLAPLNAVYGPGATSRPCSCAQACERCLACARH